MPPEVSTDNADIASSVATKTAIRIFYCSRTHSQVKQMIATLKNTPYRPKMAVLGSRDKLCINEDLRPRDGFNPFHPSSNVNHDYRIRVGNTEKYRRACMAESRTYLTYNYERPPV